MSEQHRLHLPEKYLQQVHALLRQHIPQAEVWAYGSRVHGDGFEASDLDLVARFPDGAAPDAMRLRPLRKLRGNPIITHLCKHRKPISCIRAILSSKT